MGILRHNFGRYGFEVQFLRVQKEGLVFYGTILVGTVFGRYGFRGCLRENEVRSVFSLLYLSLTVFDVTKKA